MADVRSLGAEGKEVAWEDSKGSRLWEVESG